LAISWEMCVCSAFFSYFSGNAPEKEQQTIF